MGKLLDAARLKIELDEECDRIIKNTIELKRAMLASNNVSTARQIKQIVKNFGVISDVYSSLKKTRK